MKLFTHDLLAALRHRVVRQRRVVFACAGRARFAFDVRARSASRGRFRAARFGVALLCALATLPVVRHITTTAKASDEARASSIADYRERVHAATIALDALAATDEDTSAEEHERATAAVVRDVRAMLPPKENVEAAGATCAVDNVWLHASFDAYEKIPSSETTARAGALARIAERLRALDQRLAETDNATSRAPADTRRAAQERLENILRRPEYARAKPKSESALSRFTERFREWLRGLMPEPKPIQPGQPAQSKRLTTATQIFIWVLSLVVIVFVVWKYGGRYFTRGRLTGINLRRRPRVVLGELLAADQTAADLLDDAEQLARTGNLRGAIRKAYVALLCELGDRKILSLAQHKTNRDYLRTLRREHASLYGTVAPLTQNFERHWYGHEAADADDWMDFRARCRQVLASTE